MYYNEPPLTLDDSTITDARSTISVEDLPDPEPECRIRLRHTTPLMERLWRIALADIENNIVQADGRRYFGAGSKFGAMVYTRDISYSGILGLNALYPELTLDSIRHTRRVRSELMFRVSSGCTIDGIDVPWVEENISEPAFIKTYNTNSYTRRTDDVVWLWAAGNLLEEQGWEEEWSWLYETGKDFFAQFYDPFFDPDDGLYFGQASFIDVHFTDRKTTGYPQDWTIQDCVKVKSLSTNCLYVLALDVMADAACRVNKNTEAQEWQRRRDNLKDAIRTELRHADGTFAYLKDRHGTLQQRREALGSALLVLSDVLTEEEAQAALRGYPVTDAGIPLFHPFFERDDFYHNNSSWPFVDTFFLKALEQSDGVDRTPLNTSLLARTCVGDGTFHEVTDYRTKEVKGSGSQLWTAAAFIDTCRRAGLWKDHTE